MRKRIIYLMVFVLACCLTAEADNGKRKKKSAAGKSAAAAMMGAARKEKEADYSKLLKDARTRKGMITLHMVKGTLYMEIPLSLMGRQLLFGGRVAEISDNSDVIPGQMPSDPLLVEWSRFEDKVFLHQSVGNSVCDPEDPIRLSLERNNMKPVLKAFPIKAYNRDSSAVVVDGTKLFCSDGKPVSPFIPSSPFDALFGMKRMKGTFKADLSSIMDFKAFPKNISVRSRVAYTVSGEPFSAVVNLSMILLPDEPMRPRLLDFRMGYFADRKIEFSSRTDKSRNVSYINRWRIEPKPEDVERYRRGEMVEPAKPIVYYVDDALPEKWRKYIKLGIEDWQKAFEAIGFRNAIIARDFPKDDPDFDPEDIRYSCFRYATTNVANAMGPSWTDPRSGEIIQGAVYMYHDVLKLVHNWKFVQTAQVDPKARQAVFDEETMGASLRYVASHEIGHTLGLMHNMRASYSLPVDSLRSPTFTARYGTTTSIMDYARNNYVAQPEDRDVRLIPPLVGVYDIFMIRLGYAPIYDAATPEDEYETLNRWILEKADDPMYTYGEQQVFGTVDPASQSESLGDDAVKASRYGISNLRYIMKHLLEWSTEAGRPYRETKELYNEMLNQYYRYMNHCMAYIGGLYLHHPVAGDGQKSFDPVSRAKQKEVVKFFFDEFRDQPQWLMPEDVLSVLKSDVEIVPKMQARILRGLLNGSTLGKVGINAGASDEPYTQREYLDDLYRGIWGKTLRGAALDKYERNLQYEYVKQLMKELDMTDAKPGKAARSLELTEERFLMPCERFEYQWRMAREMTSDTKESDLKISAKTLFFEQLSRLEKLLKDRRNSGSAEDRAHYAYLYFEISRALD